MTREEILEMPAGNEIDTLILTKIMDIEYNPKDGMNYRVWKNRYSENSDFYFRGIPHYSTDIEAAWEIVEKCRLHTGPTSEGFWYASNVHDLNQSDVILVIADTAPLAICRAALLAVGETDK